MTWGYKSHNIHDTFQKRFFVKLDMTFDYNWYKYVIIQVLYD